MDSEQNAPPTNWLWVQGEHAAQFAEARDKTTEALRKGQGLLSLDEFVRLLRSGEIEVLILKNKCAALITWGQSTEGALFNVMTVTGTIEDWVTGFDLLEQAARAAGAKMMVGIGHPGWTRTAKLKGYEIIPRIFMRKVLS